MNSSSQSLAVLTNAITQFNRYTPMPVFVFGLVGNALNMAIFTRPSLRKNACSVYLLSATCANMNVLIFGLLVRSLVEGFDVDLIGASLILCRLRYVILHPSYVLSSWSVVLASLDRYCVSSRHARLRNLSRRSIACATVAIAVCFCLLLFGHILFLFGIEELSSGVYCYAQPGVYRIVYDFLLVGSFNAVPPIFMLVIGIATVRNIYSRRARIDATRPVALPRQLNRKDRQLVWLLLVQIAVTIVCTAPHAVLKLYLTFTVSESKSPFRLAIENLLAQITRQLVYINASTSFYL